MEKEWGGSSGMYSAVASLNDATPEKGEHLWVSRPAVLMLARLYVFQPWDLHGVQGINMGSCPAAQKSGDLRWDQLQPLPLGNHPPRTWGWTHGRKEKPLLCLQRNLAAP